VEMEEKCVTTSLCQLEICTSIIHTLSFHSGHFLHGLSVTFARSPSDKI